ncbi:aminotransferase class IV [Myceligenerans indicum]|uniref:Aminotransferase IV n=1 Tax=Myceligenerans indicum TaxID=2593663 RepID=A0ABS1LL80_9MICO|nr:aminotransferase class IV [Myceligenerans indicum]MBL0886981.1 aminotransferase IV [Myceligenerans indicum]
MLQTFDERNRDLRVWINGRLTHRDEARVSPFDSLVQGGDGVWEGLRLHEGRIFALDEHLARLRRSATALAFTQIPTDEEIIAAVRETLAANDMRDDVHIRLTLGRGEKITSGMDPRLNQAGPTLIVLAEFKPPVYDAGGITLVTSSVRRHRADSLDPKIHHNNLLTSILAKIEANVAGADDALMLDDAGFVAETNATHVFHVSGGVLRTSTTRACPEGITRATVLDLATELDIPVVVGDFSQTDLYTADEAFVTGTMGGLAPVLSVDGRPIGAASAADGGAASGPGPVTARLTSAYADLTATSGTQVC